MRTSSPWILAILGVLALLAAVAMGTAVDRPRDLLDVGYYMLVPLIGGALVMLIAGSRPSEAFSAGLAAAVLSMAGATILGMAIAIVELLVRFL